MTRATEDSIPNSRAVGGERRPSAGAFASGLSASGLSASGLSASGLSAAFMNLSILTKALIGAGCSLFIVAVVSLTNSSILVGIEESFSVYRDRDVVLETADRMERRFLEMRRYAKELALTGSEAAGASLFIALSSLNETVPDGRTNLVKPAHLQYLKDLSNLLADYEAFLRLSHTFRATQRALKHDILDDASERIRDTTYMIARLTGLIGARETQLRSIAGLETVVIARLNVNMVLAQPSESRLSDAAQSLIGLRALLVELKPVAGYPLVKPFYEELKVETERYIDGFDILASIAKAVDDLDNRLMVATASHIAETIEALRSDALADTQIISNTLKKRILDANLVNLVMFFLALVIGAISAWFIAVATASPVIAMTRAMRRLAAGDKSATPPALDRRDEVGEMAAALTVFRASMIEAERLAKIEQKDFEEANQLLEARVAERTLALEQSRQELLASLEQLKQAGAEIAAQEKMASLGRVVAGVAHEVNTPLGVAVTASSCVAHFSETLKQKVSDNRISRSELLELVSNISQGADLLTENISRAARLIKSFKQISGDQHVNEECKLLLGPYVKDIMTSLGPEIHRRGHELDLDLEEHIEITLQPDALWQILSNLVMNALHHGLTAEHPGHLSVSLSTSQGMAMIRVADDGVGIAPGISDRIFEPFFTTKRGRGGIGLGLSVVNTIVTQALGGRILCESTPGEGTEFTIFIPLQREPPALHQNAGAEQGQPRDPRPLKVVAAA